MFEFIYKMSQTRKKIFTLILLFLMLANLIAAVLIFFDIQIIRAPEIDLDFKLVDINEEELKLEAKMNIYNPNSFEISIEDFNIQSMSKDDYKIGDFSIKDGVISSSKTKSFIVDDTIKFKEDSDFKILSNKITGRIGVNFLGFIKKTIPIELDITISVEELIDNIKIPDVDLEFILDDLVEDGIKFNIGVNVNNSNNVGIFIDKFTVNATDVKNKNFGSFNISGGKINPNAESYFESDGILTYEFLDTQNLNLKLNGDASVKIAGLNQSLSLSADMSFAIPDIKEFIFQNDNIKFYIPVQFKFRLNGIISTVGFKYYNPSNVTLVARNLNCSLYRVDGSDKSLLGTKKMDSCIIDPREEVCLKTEIFISYIDFLFAGKFRLLPDWIVLTIEGDFAIAGTRQAIPLSLNAYVNPNIFKNQEFSE